MRRIILFFVFVAFSMVTYSQVLAHAFSAQIAKWDGKTWEYFNLVSCDIDLIFSDNLILVKDQADSHYITNNVISEEGETVKWNAVDDKNVEIIIIMTEESGYHVLVVMYQDRLYKYYYTLMIRV